MAHSYTVTLIDNSQNLICTPSTVKKKFKQSIKQNYKYQDISQDILQFSVAQTCKYVNVFGAQLQFC